MRLLDIMVRDIEDGQTEHQAQRCENGCVQTREVGSPDAFEESDKSEVPYSPSNEGGTEPKRQDPKNTSEAAYFKLPSSDGHYSCGEKERCRDYQRSSS